MARRPDARTSSPRYYVGFGLTAALLAAATLVLVLVVLPRRYVLNAGLRESGVSFPSETAPFVPPQELRTEAPPPPPPAAPVLPGPAEALWAEVSPLLETGSYRATLPLFEEYLAEYPEDLGALKEHAITLQKAGDPARALSAYERLLSAEDDSGVRLLLARGLRDAGRLEEASSQYQLLLDQDPDNTPLALEYGRALSWGKDFTQAGPCQEEVSEGQDRLRVEGALFFVS